MRSWQTLAEVGRGGDMRVLGLFTVAVALGPLLAAAFLPPTPLAHLPSSRYPAGLCRTDGDRRAAVFHPRYGRDEGITSLRAGLDPAIADAVVQAVNTQLPEAVLTSRPPAPLLVTPCSGHRHLDLSILPRRYVPAPRPASGAASWGSRWRGCTASQHRGCLQVRP